MNKIKTFEGFKDIFKSKTDKEKLEKAYNKAKKSYNDMITEAGGEEKLSKGVDLGYGNFGDFSSACFDCVEILKDLKNYEDFAYYKQIFNDIIELCSKVNYIRGVSEYSSSQLQFVKRNLILLKKKYQ